MTKQSTNVFISAAVLVAAALLLLVLAFATGTRAPANPAAQSNAAAPAVPHSQAPAPVAAKPNGKIVGLQPGAEVKSPSGLIFIDRAPGTGPAPAANGSVIVHYEGFLDDGTKFDSSRDRGQPAEFPLNGVIAGFSEGLASMKVGGVRTLIIPSELGYGPNGSPPTIPPNARLRFEVELVGVK